MLRNGTEFVRLRGGEQKCAKKYGVLLGVERLDLATTAVSPDQTVSGRNLLTCFGDSPYVGLSNRLQMLHLNLLVS